MYLGDKKGLGLFVWHRQNDLNVVLVKCFFMPLFIRTSIYNRSKNCVSEDYNGFNFTSREYNAEDRVKFPSLIPAKVDKMQLCYNLA